MTTTKKSNLLTILLISLCACLIYAISSGIRSNYGVMLSAISENSGVSYSSVSFVLAVAQLTFGIMQPVFGILALRKSNSFVLCLGAILLAGGLLLIPACHSMASLLLFLGILMPAGTGALSFGIIMGAITPLLGEKKAATVSGLVSASSGLGSIILSPALQSLLAGKGLWSAMLFLSVPTLCLIPISIWLSKYSQTGQTEGTEKNVSLKVLFLDAIQNRSYQFLMIAFFTCGFHMAIIETHLFTQITTYGFSEKTAAYAFSLYGITTMAGSVISGILCSKFRMKWVLGGFFGSRPFIILAFLLLPKNIVTIYLVAALLGFTGSSTVPPTSGLVGKLFGPAKLATLFGIVFVSHQVGSFFSSWLGGICVSATGGYTLIWCVSAVFSTVAAIVSFCVKEEKHQA